MDAKNKKKITGHHANFRAIAVSICSIFPRKVLIIQQLQSLCSANYF